MKIDDARVLEEVSTALKAMADPTRLRILQELMDQEKCVSELVSAVQTTQANVSKHLAILRRAHLVDGVRDGVNVRYRVIAEFLPEVCEALCRGLAARLEGQHHLRRRVDRILRNAANDTTSKKRTSSTKETKR